MEANGAARKRWTETRRRRSPTLYDEYLSEEKGAQHSPDPRRASIPLPAAAAGDAEPVARSSGSTIRAVTPSDVAHAAEVTASEPQSPTYPGRGPAANFDQFMPHTTTTIVGGPAALASPSSRSSAEKSKKLVKERGARMHGPPSSRNGSIVSGMLARNTSKSNGHPAPEEAEAVDASMTSTRTRSKTLEDKRRERVPVAVPAQSRERTSSMYMPASPSSGAEYLASVPAETSPPSAPSIKSVGSAVQSSLDLAGRRSISPDSSSAGDSMQSSERSSTARRILHLMKMLNGRYSGSVLLRRNATSAWTPIYCYVREETGELMYEPRGGDGVHRALVPNLTGCHVRPNGDEGATGNTAPYLQVSLPQSDIEFHLKLLTQVDFDSWYAALLYWQSLGPASSPLSNDARPTSSTSASDTPSRPQPPPRTSSAKHTRDRTGSTRSERRKSVVNSLREAPVIKIGMMMFWDASAPNTPAAGGQHNPGRPQVYRTQSYGSHKWRTISAQLRENGELKLHSDLDNSLISVVELSQLSRCAIQRLHPSVLDGEYCIAIYPQYTSSPSDSPPRVIRPIFLGLENRVLCEVWFALLRAFTIPQLYGPRTASEDDVENTDAGSKENLENMLATTTTDMFRMERSLNIRVVEAKMYPPTSTSTAVDTGFSGGHNRGLQANNLRPEQHGYYAEVLLDNETRGKTTIKFDSMNPLWGESFEFLDLPPVLNSASVIIKRRPPDPTQAREAHESRVSHDPHGLTNEHLAFDVVCGKVEIYLQELEDEKEIEKWWPVVNMHNQRVGDMLIKARADEDVILMARDYQPLEDLLHRFANGITLQIAQLVPGELKRVSDCLLNIYQVSGKASDWMMALVEEEIDGIHEETPISRLRFNKRSNSEGGHDTTGTGGGNTDRELIVRDMNKTAALEANLLFRGNTLLTKSLDAHMRRVGKQYLEESIGAKLKEINEKDPDCEVDPNRVAAGPGIDRNWRRLLLFTQEVWESIVAAKDRCPIELRIIFRHIRACAEDRYGDFLRTVSYSSVSGFLFLRFFCPAVLNPKLFSLLKDDIKPRTRRTFTLIAKSLQTLSNMASFGSKETWMEPMNAFLQQNRAKFKSFIDDVCYVPAPLSAATYSKEDGSSSAYPYDIVSAETNLSYNTPMMIMQRLPPTSREGFPSLPFLIDQPRAYAELVEFWLEATTAVSGTTETPGAKSHAELMAAIKAAGQDLMSFHEICTNLHRRTQECLNRAERAERPHSASSFKWDELIDQLKTENGEDMPTQTSIDSLAENIAKDPSISATSGKSNPAQAQARKWIMRGTVDDQTTPARSAQLPVSEFDNSAARSETSDAASNVHDSLLRAQLHSRGSESASVSNVSSAVSSDTEHNPTALPNYERQRHRERREAAKLQIKQHVEAARLRETEKEKRKVRTPIVSALRKKNQRENKSGHAAGMEGYASHG